MKRILLLLLLSFFQPLYAYRVSDPIDTIVWTNQDIEDATRAQQPLFGIPTTVRFTRNGKFSLGFVDGYHTLSWIDTRHLDKLIVSFVYSRDGGTIHSVFSKRVSGGTHENGSDLEVDYEWIEEAPIDLEAGFTLMFISAFLVSIVSLSKFCRWSDEGGGGHRSRRTSQRTGWNVQHGGLHKD